MHKLVLPYPPQQNPATPNFPPGARSACMARAFIKTSGYALGAAPKMEKEMMTGAVWKKHQSLVKKLPPGVKNVSTASIEDGSAPPCQSRPGMSTLHPVPL